MARKDQTISDILLELSGKFSGIVAERDVMDRVLELRPSSAKNPYTSIRQQIRYDGPRSGWVGLGNGELMPFHSLLQGLRFRLVPNRSEVQAGMVSLPSLLPFVHEWPNDARVIDANGAAIQASPGELPESRGVNIGEWMRQHHFAPGDSVLVTVEDTNPLVLRFEHEQAADFRADRVAAQEQELADALAEQIARNQRGVLTASMAVLPVYARAAWRTTYPGRPWQALVARDRRMSLVDANLIGDADFRSPYAMLFGDDDVADQDEAEQELLRQINALQDELRASRRAAVERGLWDGMAPRVSTAQTVFDFEAGTSTTIYPGAVDALEDHSAIIEEHIANGDYEDEELTPEDSLFEFESSEGEGDEFGEINEIDDIQLFVDENPEIAAATRRLMESLTPEEQQRLDSARSIEDVQQVLGPHLPDLIRREPRLFVPLTPEMYEFHETGNGHNGNGHNGNGHSHDNDLLSNNGWEDDPAELGAPDQLFEGDEFEDEDNLLIEGSSESIDAAVERSSELLDRFVDGQVRAGKSKSTATSRAGDLWLYADFLARYYGRSLDQGDYATLDECLFFFYPRKVLSSSPRNARELCTSAKQFYSFLKTEHIVGDDAFANAIWQRRDQAARVVELYDQIDGDSDQFERLFAHLFAPYTA